MIGLIAANARSVNEITECKRALTILRASEEGFRDIFVHAISGMALIALDDRFIRVNAALCQMLGYSEQQLLNRKCQSLLHPEDAETEREYIHKLLGGIQQRYETSTRYLHKDGSIRWLQSSRVLLRDHNNIPRYFLAQAADISQHVALEEAVRLSEERFQLIAKGSSDGIWDWNIITGEMFYSARFRQLLGYDQEELDNKFGALESLLHPNERDQTLEAMRAHLRHRLAYDVEHRLRLKSGRYRWFRSRGQALWNEHNQPLRMLGSITDIGAQKQAEAVLRQTVANLRRSNTELEQFAYVASHDLQEPLRMVSSYLQLLQRRYHGKLGVDGNDFIAYAVEGARHMQKLIKDLLAYSRVSTQGQPFELTDCGIVLERVLVNLSLSMRQSQAQISHGPLPTVWSDPEQLALVFQNLIANAIKFHGDAPPKVHISAQRQEHDWLFAFRDEGIGIDPQYFKRIFIIFQRLHTRDKYPGTGIGLAICNKIVERHGGHMWLESQRGRGSTFYFTIPVSPPRSPEMLQHDDGAV